MCVYWSWVSYLITDVTSSQRGRSFHPKKLKYFVIIFNRGILVIYLIRKTDLDIKVGISSSLIRKKGNGYIYRSGKNQELLFDLKVSKLRVEL